MAKIKLDLVLKSGATVRVHVTDYSIKYSTMGDVESLQWEAAERHGRRLIAIKVANIDAIVRVN
jgi:hypothetical protein